MPRSSPPRSSSQAFTTPFLALLFGPLFYLTGCGAAPREDLLTIGGRDSAGVRIMESDAPRWRAGEGWRVAESPRLTVGDLEEDPRYDLFQVTGVLQLSDGRLVVANGGTAQLRIYSASGEHLRDSGRRGAGPGEFQWIHEIWLTAGDSVMVFDAAQQRVSVIAPGGDFARSFQLEVLPEYGIPSIAHHFADGSLVSISALGTPAAAAMGMVSKSMFSATPGIVDGIDWVFTRYGVTGSFLNEIGAARESPRWNHTIQGVPSMYLPFSIGLPSSAAGRDLLYLGNGSTFEVETRMSDGELAGILRWSGQHREITRDDVSHYRNTTLEKIQDENRRRVQERWLGEVPFPDQMPAYQSLLVDALGYLWVEQYRAPWEDQPRWWIFGPDGSWLGEVETPAGFEIRGIGSDHLLTTGRGDDDIEIVALFPLYRGGADLYRGGAD